MHKSRKGFTLVEIMIVVVIIGLLAAMAIPAFNKVRQQSRVKTVTNNLRQVAGAGQQHLLDTGVSSVTYGSLVPTYFANIKTVAGEDYTALSVLSGGGSLSVGLADGTVVTLAY